MKEWLDSFEEFDDEQFVEWNNIVLGLKKQNQFAMVAHALSMDPNYGEWWNQVLEWRQAHRQAIGKRKIKAYEKALKSLVSRGCAN